MKVGIGIASHNRPEVFKKSYEQIRRLAPSGSKIVVVDDGSDIPIPDATYRFDKNAGIARSKNKCLELLQDCDHIFLFDDDAYPLKKGWERPYIESPEPHLMYIFKDFVNMKLNDSSELYRDSKMKAYTHPRGCMLYLSREVLDVVGGMDTRYRRWGYEHVDLSNRIFNAGLTSFRYADVIGSEELIYSADEHQEVASTVSRAERQPYLKEMREHFLRSFKSSEYCEYKARRPLAKTGINIVLATYLTGAPDPQRSQWVANYDDVKTLADSVSKNGERLVIVSDTFTPETTPPDMTLEIECVEPMSMNPYFRRWLLCYQYLRDHPEVERVFCVDATDVEMLRSPFKHMDDRLYTGDEPTIVGTPWMLHHHRNSVLYQFISTNRLKPLINCGLLGGTREQVMEFIHRFIAVYYDNGCKVGDVDMGTFNYVAYTYFSDVLSHGPHVNTRFKAFDYNNTQAWFRHK